MAKMSRDKGKVGEREVAALLRAYDFEAKRGIQFQGGIDSPDVKHDIPDVHIEVKRVERLNLNEALAQAYADAGFKKAAVFHRSSRQPWLVTIDARDYLDLQSMKRAFFRIAERQVNPPIIIQEQPKDSDFEKLRNRIRELEAKVNEYEFRDYAKEHSEKQVDLIRASAGSSGCATEGGKAGTTEGEGRGGTNSTGVDPAST